MTVLFTPPAYWDDMHASPCPALLVEGMERVKHEGYGECMWECLFFA
jgi:hypothetical protein